MGKNVPVLRMDLITNPKTGRLVGTQNEGFLMVLVEFTLKSILKNICSLLVNSSHRWGDLWKILKIPMKTASSRDIQSHKLPSGWVINLGFIVFIVNPGWLLYRIFTAWDFLGIKIYWNHITTVNPPTFPAFFLLEKSLTMRQQFSSEKILQVPPSGTGMDLGLNETILLSSDRVIWQPPRIPFVGGTDQQSECPPF